MADPAPGLAAPKSGPAVDGDVVDGPALEVDTWDGDSSLGDDTGSMAPSSTASLGSSIFKYREENGRRYHAYKDGAYVFPNDAREQERLDLQHNLFILTFHGRLCLSPPGDPPKKPDDDSSGPPTNDSAGAATADDASPAQSVQRVLDVGTGTGIWAVDYADEHPEAHVIGVDLSPIQRGFVPPNVEFQVDDLEEDWTFSDKFDFIISRMLSGSFADWPKFFRQSYDNLNPGGWIELQDICLAVSDDKTLDGTDFDKWNSLLREGTEKIGRSFDNVYTYKQKLEDAGFINVQQRVFRWPMNRWPKDPHYKEIGSWTLEDIASNIEALSVAIFTRVLGWSKEEFDVFVCKVRADMKNTGIHAYWPILVVYGQKPM